MPREQKLTVNRGSERREYLVVFREDPPDRAEAVRFFQKHADSLLPDMALSAAVEGLPIEQANAFLRRHPIEERWCWLTIGSANPITDDDLARLWHLPEITCVKIFSDQVTDAGVRHLLFLHGLCRLVLYSSRVTDDCLEDIQKMRSLTSLDLQGSRNVSRRAALAAVEAMPWLRDAWLLPDPVHLSECQRRNRLSRVEQPGPADPDLQVPPKAEPPLRYVDLSKKPLERPPAELFDNDDISRLDLINCGVAVLPEAVGRLTRLRTLYANWGRLVELPDAISRLAALEELWLNDNQLTGLPETFGRLASLKQLCLDYNRLGTFPAAILELRRLENLRLTDNQLSVLPDEIGGLTELRSLSLGRNQLVTLPRGIGRLEKLTYLGLQGNPLQSLPDEVWRLPCLVTLNLAHTGLVEVPAEATNIPDIIGLPGQRVHT